MLWAWQQTIVGGVIGIDKRAAELVVGANFPNAPYQMLFVLLAALVFY